MTMLDSTPPQNIFVDRGIPLRQVLLVGGTHGNELTGIYVVKQLQAHPDLIHRSSFETKTIIGNPDAAQQVTRYVEKDLNRCFVPELWDTDENIYEKTRAKILMEHYGPESEQPTDLVIDLHSTTSNAGLMLILDHLDPFTLRLAAYLQTKEPTVKIYSAVGSGRENDSLRTVGKYRLGIEVGPIAHGTLHAELFQKTVGLIDAVLDYVERHNMGCNGNRIMPHSPEFSTAATKLTIYQYIGAIDYPKNSQGEIVAMIHPQRQFRDYEVVNPGDPMFLTFTGETMGYQGPTPVYPIFVNEAAYYEKGIAMSLTKKKQMTVDGNEVG